MLLNALSLGENMDHVTRSASIHKDHFSVDVLYQDMSCAKMIHSLAAVSFCTIIHADTFAMCLCRHKIRKNMNGKGMSAFPKVYRGQIL